MSAILETLCDHCLAPAVIMVPGRARCRAHDQVAPPPPPAERDSDQRTYWIIWAREGVVEDLTAVPLQDQRTTLAWLTDDPHIATALVFDDETFARCVHFWVSVGWSSSSGNPHATVSEETALPEYIRWSPEDARYLRRTVAEVLDRAGW